MSQGRTNFVLAGLALAAALATGPGLAVAADLDPGLGGSAELAIAPAPFELHVPVLYFHHVVCAPEGAPPSDLYICPADFATQLTYLRDHGWHSVTGDELADLLATRTCPELRRFVISFDDGPIDQYTMAAPIMERLGMRGTFLVIAHRSGKPIEMSYEQMRDLVARGHAFGNHTLNHADLSVADEEHLLQQIEGAQQVLEQELGFRPRTFAYPYGRYSAAAVQAVRDSGLELGFTVKRGARESTTEPLLSPRIDGARDTSAEHLLSKLEPYANGCPPPTADLAAALAPTGPFKGNNVYSASPIHAQTIRRTNVRVSTHYTYAVTLQNDSNDATAFSVASALSGAASMTVRYSIGGSDVSDEIAGATYVTPESEPWSTLSIIITVTPHSPRAIGTSTRVDISASPLSNPAQMDLVRLVARF